jgi:hypothetical protein
MGDIKKIRRTIIFEPMPDDIPLAEPSPAPATAPDPEAVPA